jgi:ribosomal protein S18 acetylase RimI-like enzyme
MKVAAWEKCSTNKTGGAEAVMNVSTIVYLAADHNMKDRIGTEWGENAARHIHLTDGCTIVALDNELLVGLVSAYGKKLPLLEIPDWYIDILEVHKEYRRRGIATDLIRLISAQAKERDLYQIRAWSSEDKTEAIPMWKKLGFGLCPSTTYPQGKEVQGYFVAKVL